MSANLVSIIIPFYNTEYYLKECLNAVCQQTYSQIEVILIDDGSTDSSLEIAQAFVKKYPYVSLKKIPNSGPGNARNVGLQLAKGEYIVFVDSDDLIDFTMVEQLVKALRFHKADICVCKFALFDDHSEEIFEKVWQMEDTMVTGTKAIQGMYTNQITLTVWGKIFRSSHIKAIKFPVDMIYEDRPFMLEAFFKAQKVFFINEVLVRIRKRPGSLTRSLISQEKVQNLFEIHQLEIDFINSHQLNWARTFVNRYHIMWLRISFFMLGADEKRDVSLRSVRPILLSNIQNFYKAASELSFKDRVHVQLLRLPAILGWGVARKVLQIVYSK